MIDQLFKQAYRKVIKPKNLKNVAFCHITVTHTYNFVYLTSGIHTRR